MRPTAVALAACLMLSACSHASDPGRAESPRPSASRSADRVATASELIGAWHPVELFGKREDWRTFTGKRLGASFSRRDADIAWSAADGCNSTSGTALLSTFGDWAQAGPAVTTLVACLTTLKPGTGSAFAETPQNVDAIAQASQVRLRDDQLVFSDATGDVIGIYERA
ncbi:hypothetical protein [Nocardioides jejuensis]|uniref:META domain-containing protein n=1 Tax=Nocardioides jejuensis TaxID=2502782 RepID=A0A4R1CKY5_9ACTN|nr:hypothetical protein [Nocardioides jejuensis]TCJ30876.1 hypothetical protein EPD65_02235 [Nocardioides jejuensis]